MAAYTHALTSPLIQSNLHYGTEKPMSLKPQCSHNPSLSLSWLGSTSSTQMTRLSLHISIPKRHMHIHRPISATVLSSLPTAEPARSDAENVPKWTMRGIKALSMAKLEARKLKKATTGTEALLMGVLIEGTNLASKYLWANGITLFKVREEANKILEKANLYFFPPEQPPFTEEARKAVDWAVDHKLRSGDNGEVTTADLVLGIWSVVGSPGHKVLATLGFNDEKAKELESLSSVPDSVDGWHF